MYYTKLYTFLLSYHLGAVYMSRVFHINATGRASPPSRAGNLANTHAQIIRIIQNAQTTPI
jgi:hypothetical protein